MISRTATRAKISPVRQGRSNPHRRKTSAIDHAVRVVHRVCCLAGAASLIDDIRAELRAEGILTAIRRHDTATLFDWLISALSYQGISDQVATDYMERHGRPRWADIDAKVAACPTCPKLESYWHFHGCRYTRSAGYVQSLTTSMPVPCRPTSCATVGSTRWPTRYSCSFATSPTPIWSGGSTGNSEVPMTEPTPIGLPDYAKLVIGPLREVYGVSDKVLTMTLSCILLAAPKRLRLWHEVGASMIAIDTLVHNFLVRTGILARFEANHSYGAACYQAGGCADIINAVAQRIDAQQFNPGFPQPFPRFIQHAIWRYCAQSGLDVCNGNRMHKRLLPNSQ